MSSIVLDKICFFYSDLHSGKREDANSKQNTTKLVDEALNFKC